MQQQFNFIRDFAIILSLPSILNHKVLNVFAVHNKNVGGEKNISTHCNLQSFRALAGVEAVLRKQS